MRSHSMAFFEVVDELERQVAVIPTTVAAHIGLPPGQLLAFRMVMVGLRRVSEVADAMLVSPSTASRSIDALVTAGYVHRGVDPENRRAVVLSLTPAGEDLALKMRDYVTTHFVEPVLAELGEERSGEVLDAIRDFAGAIGAVAEQDHDR